MERRLAAILAADVAGYTALMGIDEAGTLRRLTALRREFLEPLIEAHHGRIVKTMGDGILAEFASVVAAVSCALAWQDGVTEQEAATDEDKRLRFRIGINLGDVIVEGDDIHGDGVNIASRLEGLAVPSGICLSGDAYRQIKGKIAGEFEDLGDQNLKNVAEPIRAYRIAPNRSSSVAAVAERGKLTLPDKPSIAVLPFTNMSGDLEQEYFSDGITEEIITELSRFRTLFVIARSSCFTFKGRTITAQEVGRELGVAFVVQGSVRKAGNRVRVTVQLVRTDSAQNVWVERYDRELVDIFSVQDEITQKIAATIGVRLETEDRYRAARNLRTATAAYDYVLRAQTLYHEISRAANEEARPLAEKAIEIDSESARAHMLLAAIHNMNYMESWSPDPDESLNLALEHGQRAISLDDSDCLAHAQFGEILANHFRFSEAKEHFEKALLLNPNDVEARAIYGAFIGGDDGLEHLAFAERLDPCNFVWIPWIKGITLFELRRYEEAIASLQKTGSRITSGRGYLAASLALAGRTDEAHIVLDEFLESARMELPSFPENATQWQMYWLRESQHPLGEEHFQHLCEGLRKAGLEI